MYIENMRVEYLLEQNVGDLMDTRLVSCYRGNIDCLHDVVLATPAGQLDYQQIFVRALAARRHLLYSLN